MYHSDPPRRRRNHKRKAAPSKTPTTKQSKGKAKGASKGKKAGGAQAGHWKWVPAPPWKDAAKDDDKWDEEEEPSYAAGSSSSSWNCDWKMRNDCAHWGGWESWTDSENWDKPCVGSEERRRRRTASASVGPSGQTGWGDKDDEVEVVEVAPDENEVRTAEVEQLNTWRQLLQIPDDGTPPGVQALPSTVQTAIQQATVITSPDEMVAFLQGFSRFLSLLIAEVSRAIHRGQGEQKAPWAKRDDHGDGPDKDEQVLMQVPGLPAMMAGIKHQLQAQPADRAQRRTQAFMAQLRASAYYRFREAQLEKHLRLIETSLDGPGASCSAGQEVDADDTRWAWNNWQVVSAALGRAMVSTARVQHWQEPQEVGRKRKVLEQVEQMEWEGVPGLYVTASDPASQERLAVAHLPVPATASAMQVTVRYQPSAASSSTGEAAQEFSAIMPADMGPVVAPLVFQPEGTPHQEQDSALDYFHVWSQGLMSDAGLQEKIGEEGLRLYRGVTEGMRTA